MKKYILGGGGFAKEVYLLLITIYKNDINFGGFIDHDSGEIIIGKIKLPVISEKIFINDNKSNTEIELYIGIGNPSILINTMAKYEFCKFPNLIHPSVNFNNNFNNIGKGNIICAGCNFTVNIGIGDFNLINLNTTIGHDSKIGSYNVINPGTNISGSVNIGDLNLIGTNSTILQNLNIVNNNLLGAGSLLTKDLGSNQTAVGVPARIIKETL
jgi:sugar O-acyltransferase (sialic acid O-acetyltransferase NeuD family)